MAHIDKWIESFFRLTPPLAPDEVDAIRLEDRILYSATPLPVPQEAEGDVSGGSEYLDAQSYEQLLAEIEEITNSVFLKEQASEESIELPSDPDQTPEPLLLSREDQAESESSDDAPAVSQTSDTAAPTSGRQEIVFVQEGLYDLDVLLDDLQREDASADYTIHVLSSVENGLNQIKALLAEYDDLDAIHIVSHGSDGMFQLGNSWIASENIANYAEQLRSWGMALGPDGDIVIYGCDVASSNQGAQLIDTLATLTSADVIASTDKTGSSSAAGDWELEYQIGSIETTIAFSSEFTHHWGGLLDAASTGVAIWAEGGTGNTELEYYDGTNFGSESNGASSGEYRIIDGADSRLRDERIIVGMNSAGVISGQMWNGTTWTNLGFTMGTTSSGVAHGFDVQYEAGSDQALLVWNNGTTGTSGISYSVWDGSTWSSVQTLTSPLSGEARSLQLVSNPSSDEMILVASNSSSDSYAFVWNGSSWGNSIILENGSGGNQTDSYVAYEHLSGEAIVVYDAISGGSDLNFRTWNGSSWSAQNTWTSPGSTGDPVYVTLASDPNSDRIALSASTSSNEAWFAVWNGSSWGNQTLASNTLVAASGMMASVAFESTSGELLAVYAENSTSLSVRTWTQGGGWSAEQYTPSLGSSLTPAFVSLYSDPASNHIMLGVLDSTSDVNFIEWDGGSWGSVTEVETSAGTNSIEHQPYIYLWNSVNEAPILDASKSPTLIAQNEDSGSPSGVVGTLISSMIDFSSPSGQLDNVTDSDAAGLLGIAVTGANTSQGTWWYTTNGGTTWSALGSVSDSNARLLASDSNTRLYFQPNANYNGTISDAITFRAWDRSSGTNGATVSLYALQDLTVRDNFDTQSYGGNNGTNSWSASWQEIGEADGTAAGSVTVATSGSVIAGPYLSLNMATANRGLSRSVNLSGATSATLSFTYEQMNTSAGGQVALQIYNGSTWTTLHTYSVDSSFYSGNVGVFQSFNISSYANSNTAIRFLVTQAASNDYFYIDDVKIDYSVNALSVGGTTAFSTATDTAGLSITAVNDAPVLTPYSPAVSFTEDSAGMTVNVATLLGSTMTDVDSGALQGIAFTGVSGSGGVLSYSINGGATWLTTSVSETSALLLRSTDLVRFTPSGDNGGQMLLSYRAWDQTSGSAGTFGNATTNGGTTAFSSSSDTVTVTVTSANDAPVLDNSGSMSLNSITEDPSTNSGQSVASIVTSAGGDRITDVDTGAVEGIAVTSLNSSNGTWQFSIDGGTTWSNMGAVSNTSALLLRSTDLVRFTPNGENATTADFSFRAWDRTTGTQGTYVSTATHGGTSAFSTAIESASINVTAVNDAPIAVNDSAIAIEAGGISNNTPGTNPTGNVLSNDTDVDSGDTKAVQGVSAGVVASVSANVGSAVTGSYGSITIVANGAYTYTVDNSNATVQALRSTSNTIQDVFSYTVRDAAGLTSTTQITVTIQGSNDSPYDITGAPLSVNENVSNTTVVGSVTGIDLDSSLHGETLAYSLTDTAGGRFAIHSSTGQITVADGSLLNRESAATHSITVRVTDASGASFDKSFQISINDLNEFDVSAISDTNATVNSISENATNGTLVGITAAASDADATNNSITYSLLDSAGGRFSIDATTGVVSVANGSLIDYETAQSHNITIRATSADSSTSDQVFTIAVNAVNDNDPTITSDGGGSSSSILVYEGALFVTTVVASDADLPTGLLSYSITGGVDASKFTIDAATGVLMFTSPADFESPTDVGANNTYNLIVQVSDGSRTDTQSIAVSVQNAADNGQFLDRFSSSSYTNSNGTQTWSNSWIESEANGSASGNIGISNNALRVSASTVNDSIYRSVDLSNAISANFDFNYRNTLVGSQRIEVQISGNGGATYNTLTVLDGSTNSGTGAKSYDISAYRSSDTRIRFVVTSVGGSTTKEVEFDNVQISYTPNNAPVITSNGSLSTATIYVAENSTSVTTVTAVDGDAPAQTLTYSIIGGTDASRFVINSSTGALSFVSSPNFEGPVDQNSDNTYNVTVQVSDGIATDNQILSVVVTDVDEFDVSTPTDSNGTVNAVNENVAVGTTVGVTANAFDLDASTNTITYSLTSNPDSLFQIDANTGVVTTAAAINREVHGSSRSITVQAISSDGSIATQTFNIAINDLDEFDVSTPTDTNAVVNEVNENVAVGTTVGITASAFDLDATTNTITYSLTSNPDSLFQIDANTGIVTTAAAINREVHGASRSITVQATSSDGSIASQTFNIAINDLDEFDVSTPTDTNAAVNEVNENVAVGTTVGVTANAFDLDSSTNTITFSLTSNPDSLFQIDANTGIVTTAAAINREVHGASRSITVQATSSDGSIATQTFNIGINDLDEFDVSTPTDSDVSTNEVDENVAIGTNVGITADAFDLDATTNTITYSLTSNPDGLFQIDANTGIVTTAAAINREVHGASRSITVQATSSDGSIASQTFNIAINDLDEFEVSPPTDTNAAVNEVDENVAVGTTVGITADAFDLDAATNTITYSLTSNPDGLFQIDTNTGIVTTADAINREVHGATRSITVQATSSDGSIAMQTFNIGINDLDEFDVSTPTDTNAAVNEVNENVAVGTTVGISANAFDLDATTNTITYSLTSNPDGLFQIDTNTGVVTTAAAINREVHGASRSITVQATSSDGSIATQTFNIGINDLDEFDVSTPTDTNAAVNEVNENVAVGTTVGISANAFDLDATTNTITYSLTSNPDGLFQIDTNTGIVTTAAAINREVHGATRSITVQATSSDGSTATQSFVITINDLDEFDVSTPTDTNVAANEVNENVVVGTTVGIAADAFDLDATTNTITYSLTNNPDGLFQIDANTGVVTTAAAINREVHGASRSITVQATSSDGSTTTQSFSIDINDLDEFDVSTPTDTNAAANEVNENVAVGTTAGITADAFDLDATTNTITYSLTNNPDGLFHIDANTGIVTTANAINREVHGASRSITVQATSSDGSTATQSFVITINDLDEFDVSTPTDTNVAANEVNENVVVGTTVGIAADAFDLDATTNTITYSLTSNPDGLFQIDSNTGVVTTAAAINREVHGASRSITVQATSSDGSTATQTFNIGINDLDEFDVSTPTDIDVSTDAVDENIAIGTAVGITADAFDLDATTNTITYSLTSNPDGLFQIDANTGVVTTAASINREVHGAIRSITVQATSSDGSAATQSFHIAINDLDEFDISTPTDTDVSTNAVDENVALGTTVGLTADAFDLDATTNTITYSLTSNPDGLFQIDASTGVVTTATAINREVHGANRFITVQATSSDGSSATQSFHIAINDLDEFDISTPTDTDVSTNAVDENVALGTTVGLTADAFDLDATTNTITYSLTSNPDGLFQIDASTGVVTTATAINREVHGANRFITVQATSSDGSSATQSFHIAINDLDEFDVSTPTDANLAVNEVNENVAVGTTVGITADAFDLDATTNTITYSLTSNPDGLFQIDANTGVVTTAASINREVHGAIRSITVQATSSDGSAATQSFSIDINDLDEFDVSTPTDANAAVNEVQENVAVGTSVGITADAFDLDATTNTITYSLTSNPDGLFQIDASTGVVTTATAINREVHGANRSITVQATSSDGSSATQSFHIAINDLDEFDVSSPTDIDVSTDAVDENVAVGTTVGITADAFDLDATTNTITYSLTSNPDGLFQIDANTGVVTTAASINREVHGANRSITVQATSSDGSAATQSFHIAISDLDEFDISTPTDTDVSTNAVDENVALGTTVGLTADAFDLDATTNTITYSLTSNPDGLFQIDASTGVVTTATAINREVHGANRFITVQATSSDGSSATQSFHIAINDLDEFEVSTPTDANLAVNEVNENVAVGTTVGITADAFDLDATTNTITYSLTSNPDGLFQIDANTGVVTTAASINREVHGAIRSITVQATSSDGSAATQSFSIDINDLDEFDVSTPTDANAAVNEVQENVAVGTSVGITADAFDLDATTNTITYSLTSNPDGLFQIDASTGVVTTATAINREVHGANRSITVQATSSDGSSATQSFHIAINDLDEYDVSSPTDIDVSTDAVDENVAVGTTVGITADAFDLDATTNTITYSLTSNPDGLFQIDANTGVVTTAASINREVHGANRSITVQATSSDGSAATQSFHIAISDLDEFDISTPTDTDVSTNAVDENVALGTTVGLTADAFDLDATTNTITYSLTSNPDGLFQIDASTGVVTTATAINREVHGANRFITVQATSSDGSSATQSFHIAINDLDEFEVSTPTDANLAVNEVNENVAVGTTVGITADAFDLDATTNTITYSLTSNPDGLFQIDSNTGIVTTATAINREVHGASRSITVQATSSDGSTATQSFHIAINDLDEFDVSTPVDTDVMANEVDENSASGTHVGITASSSDADATTNSVTYSLDDSAAGRFSIDAVTGVVTVANGSLLNFEAATSHGIVVRATSVDGSCALQSYTIQLKDENEFAVSSIQDHDASVDFVLENSSVGTTVGIQAFATDVDGTDTVTYSLDNNAGGLFSIDANTGIITVSGVIDRETAASYSITIRATSTDSSSVTTNRTISIGDIDEFDVTLPTDSNSALNIVSENLQSGAIVGITALAADGDATNNGVVYSLGSNAGGRFAIDATTGIISTTQSLNYEFRSSWDVTVIATSMDGSVASSVFTIQVQNVEERPIGRADTYTTSYLDDLIVPSAGLLLNDWDPDGDSITAILVQPPARGLLLSLTPDGRLEYRPERGFVGTVQFAYQVTDGSLVSDVVIVTIQVNRPDSVLNDSTPTSNTSTKSQNDSTTKLNTATIPNPREAQQEAPSAQKEREADKSQSTAAPILVNPVTLNGPLAVTSERSDSSIGGLNNPISFSRDTVRFLSHGHLHFEVETHRLSDDLDASRFDFADSRRRVENSMGGSQAAFDSVLVRTVLGTGAILWLAQGAQFAATLVSAAPAWLHIDPLSVIPKSTETNGKQEKLSEGEKLFER
ncbi:Cadherin domain protein [Pirellula sp. SH-Sr6A]|uniref:cadherin domain-containing protein n=1 Tax=Pirellula sp. SH-Sr6A TaxID=1632865 RepID=UPI00078C230E|nr:cadherin domain-containing protein [Pirellula sp. SH-Sr6A]AMV32103.1 Cadherin domain protein [Pirellula sp. SH-Sr6A]